MEKEKKPIYKKWWFWVIIIVIIGAIGSITETNNTIETSSNVQNELKQESEEEKQQRLERERIAKEKEESEREIKRKEEEQNFKTEAEVLTYEQLARNPEKVKGKKVKLTGQVIQTLQSGTSVDLRINITKDGYGYYSDTEKYKKDFQKVSDFIIDIQEMYLNPVKTFMVSKPLAVAIFSPSEVVTIVFT